MEWIKNKLFGQANKKKYASASNELEMIKTKKLKTPAFQVFDMESTFISLDKSFEYVGDNSRYQKRVIVILSIQWTFYAFLTMGMPFLFQSPSFFCTQPNGYNYNCEEAMFCKTRKGGMLTGKSTSIANEFNLICEKRYELGIAQSLYFIGSIFAGIIFPYVADFFGRKRTLLFSVLVGGVAIFVCGYMQNIELVMLMMFISGFALNGYETISLVYVTEISAQRFRNFSGVTLMATWAASQILFSPIAYFINNWRHLCIYVFGLPLILSNFLVWKFLDESPRYLVSIAKYKEARLVLDKIATFNLRPPFEFKLLEEIYEFSENVTTIKPKKKRKIKDQEESKIDTSIRGQLGGYIDLLRNHSFRPTFLAMCYLWFFRCVVYYGINFSIEDIGAQLHLNLIFIAFSETFANILGAPIKIKMDHKRSMFISLIILSISCLFLFIYGDHVPDSCKGKNTQCDEKFISLICSMIIRFAITIFYVILLTYTSEAFPTKFRSKAYGFCMTIGRLGSSIVPFYSSYMRLKTNNPLTYMGVFGVIAAILFKYLPETNLQNHIVEYDEDPFSNNKNNNANDREEHLLKDYQK